jgi:hypothetical protein
MFTFFDKHYVAFGKPILVEFEVKPHLNYLIQVAKDLTELGFATFDECLEAAKKFHGDSNTTCEYLMSKFN